MGNFFTKLADAFDRFGMKDARILMIGLDNAGKTTILYKLKLGEQISTIPTIGFNVEQLEIPKMNLKFTVWDVGGQERIRPLWRHYFTNCDGIIYIVDSNDPTRFVEAKQELLSVLDSDELRGAPLLVLANKQDLPNARDVASMSGSLGLDKMTDRKWFLQGTCAVTGDGLIEGLDRFSQNVKQFQKDKKNMY